MSTIDSWAQTFFERLNTRGLELVEELITQQVTEELYLDYKGVATVRGEKTLHDDDRKNLAKAISGFANSEGGVIIWGVDCRPDSSGKEVVREKYLADPTWFKSLIDNNIGSLTTPFHSAVKSVALSPSIDAPGVVVTFVPEGQNVPYYSNARNALGYYMRAGTNFLPVPHGLLAGLFGRKPTPILKGSFKPNPPEFSAGSASLKLMFHVFIENFGRSLADDLFVIIDGNDQNNVRLRNRADPDKFWNFYLSDNKKVGVTTGEFHRLAPSTKVIVPLHIELEFTRGAGPFSLAGSCGCSNGPGNEFNMTLSAEDMGILHENLTRDWAKLGGPSNEVMQNAMACMTRACGL